MAGWFDTQGVDGYSQWLAQQQDQSGAVPPGGYVEAASRGSGPRAPLPGEPGFGQPPLIEQMPGAAPPTDPQATAPAAGQLPPVASAPFNQVNTGGGQYPLAAIAGEGWMRPWTSAFNAPSQDLGNNPAFKFRMDEGQKAIERSAAAKGTLFTARPMKELMRWGQGLASEEYDKIYNRSLQEYRQAHDIYEQNQSNAFNRPAALAGLGQTAANQLGSQGTSYMQGGSDLITGAGNANAAGRVGSQNAWTNGIQAIGDNAMMLALMRQQQPPPGY